MIEIAEVGGSHHRYEWRATWGSDWKYRPDGVLRRHRCERWAWEGRVILEWGRHIFSAWQQQQRSTSNESQIGLPASIVRKRGARHSPAWCNR